MSPSPPSPFDGRGAGGTQQTEHTELVHTQSNSQLEKQCIGHATIDQFNEDVPNYTHTPVITNYTCHQHREQQAEHQDSNRGYVYTEDLVKLEACRASRSVELPAGATQITTPLVARAWEQALAQHPDRQFRSYILQGIQQGFHIGFDGKAGQAVGAKKNMLSALNNPTPVEEYLQEEEAKCRVVEILPPASQQVLVNRFGVIPKRGQANQWRLILDLSYPPNRSVNDGISRDLSSLHYVSVDTAVQRVLELGQGARLAKVDIKHAYRNVPVHPDDRHMLGMRWNGRTFVDKMLPFGLRSAPKVFTALADALEWILRSQGVEWCIHYIDDFLTACPPESDKCQVFLAIIKATCEYLGFPLKWEKVEGPACIIDFLGIVLDAIRMEIRLPEEQLQALVEKWSRRRSCRKRELLSLIGKLAHACKVVRVGRLFLRRMINYSMKAKRLDHWIHLTEEFRADLGWWQAFLPVWNRRCMMQVVNHNAPVFSDASGGWGCRRSGMISGCSGSGKVAGQISRSPSKSWFP